jgi:hypothetical protein
LLAKYSGVSIATHKPHSTIATSKAGVKLDMKQISFHMLWSNHDSNISVGTTFIGSTGLQCRDHPRLDSPTRLEQMEKCIVSSSSLA